MLTSLMLSGLLLTQTPPAAQEATVPTEATPPALSEVDQLRIENHALRLRLAQLETQMRTQTLSDERTALDAALRAAYPGWTWDWQTGRLVRPEPTPETPR